MRIAVVGATGNTGTAVLKELASQDNVKTILGIARRIPDHNQAPSKHVQWRSVDIQFPQSREELAELFADCDAVIHLAWLIQPNTNRELLRKVNVDGTRNVLEAAAEAGVAQVVVASSVGAYSAAPDDALYDETWPTNGLTSSHYSVDKAAQEQVINEFQEAHPDINVATLRPALIFQASAGSEIQRYFLAQWVPVKLLEFGRPPVVPLPAGLRVQAVHATDVARAYVLAATGGAHGAFNICADDILDTNTIGGILTKNPSKPRVLSVTPKVLRPMLMAAHRTRLIAADEGWLDMGLHLPLMDNTKAQRELGWYPTTTAAQALTEVLDGMIHGSGAPTEPMQPRSEDAVADARLPSADHKLPDTIDSQALRSYMADHVAGSAAGQNRIHALAQAFQAFPIYSRLAKVAKEIDAEQDFLESLMQRQGFTRPFVAAPVLWAGERITRIKTIFPQALSANASVLVIETELMMSAITGKMHGWKTLLPLAEALGVAAADIEQLIADSSIQYQLFQEVHEYVRTRAFLVQDHESS